MAVEDAPNLKKHLDEAAKFYTDDSFSSTVIAYNFSWAGYYYITKDWDKCFPQFELTLSAFKGTQPMYEMVYSRIMEMLMLMRDGIKKLLKHIESLC